MCGLVGVDLLSLVTSSPPSTSFSSFARLSRCGCGGLLTILLITGFDVLPASVLLFCYESLDGGCELAFYLSSGRTAGFFKILYFDLLLFLD